MHSRLRPIRSQARIGSSPALLKRAAGTAAGVLPRWINRAAAPLDALDVTPDHIIARLTDLAPLVD